MRFFSRCLIAIAINQLIFIFAAASELPPGFSRVSGKYIDVVTDMPLNEQLRELPHVFDAAIPLWCQIFSLEESTVANWHVEAFIMLDRQRFMDAGYLPENISTFVYGFQFGDQLWVTEQPSAYYRRHLLLHEGTHWFMTRKYGRQGPAWLMEGMAELLGTHRWDGSQLVMGIIPKTKDDVPYWGRITLIQQQLTDGLAPSLETILRYSNTAHQQIEAYAWSWAAVIFLKHHPDSAKVFQALLNKPLQSRDNTNRELFRRLSTQWSRLRQEWNATLTELEYGYDPAHGQLTLSRDPRPLAGASELMVQANRSWQPSGVLVSAGTTIKLHAAGEFEVRREPRPWKCLPDGVTLEYYRGEPLGKLLMTIAETFADEPDFSLPLSTIPVGAGGEFTVPKTGELHFRVNESNAGLGDNSGTITVTIRL